jgi:hypothetical protein
MSKQDFIAAHCFTLFEKRRFSSYDDPALIDSNPDISVIQNFYGSNFANVRLKLLLIL